MKNCKKNVLKSRNGITLIALVITIIVLLILAGISISMLSGDNGILQRATDAKTNTDNAQIRERIQLAYNSALAGGQGSYTKNTLMDELKKEFETDYDVDDSDNENWKMKAHGQEITIPAGDKKKMPVTTIPPTTAVGENTKYNDGTNTAVIPKGFRVSSDATEQTIETGLVVYDGNDNEWVWIPVPDASLMYTKVNDAIAITGGTANAISGVATNYYSNSDIINGKTRGLPNSTSRREPDIVVGTDGTQYDAAEENYTSAGFESLQNMAESLVNDYEDMVKSVIENKGFYVGRYELTGTVNNPTEIAGAPIRNHNWYDLYKACKSFCTDEVESRMIWGCQWDMIAKWMSESSDPDVRSFVTDCKGRCYAKKKSSVNTGSDDNYKVNAIFDLAGNCAEFTQEAGSASERYTRSGRLINYDDLGIDNLTEGSVLLPTYSTGRSPTSTRPVIYILGEHRNYININKMYRIEKI